ncbi:choice-of-anchor I family protein [Shewanella avicenniae]|uniref:Choice-of-anchor I family protein n=1 Tax=Shewanella avicenniae TaxID=2814294 RepID=A0ABX7QLB3_9GAMM|nr:choice-of-anchor I family protein [Shewanella avicenniae]QSX32237.1 choice-of-anchor I family protein [Shewanella avicenniae]
MKLNQLALLVSSALLLAACGDDGKDGVDGSNGLSSLLHLSELAIGSSCSFGGQLVATGLDLNGNGTLEDAEVQQSQTLCYDSASGFNMELMARHESGVYGLSAAEIVDFDAVAAKVLVVNARSGKVDVLDASGLASTEAVSGAAALALNNLPLLNELDVAADIGLERLGGVNSLAVHDDLLAVAIERADEAGNSKQGNGFVAFYRRIASGYQYLKAVEVGALPDNVVFSPNGQSVLVANEGEPNNAYDVDPEGSVAIIAVVDGEPADNANLVRFTDFNVGGSRAAEVSSMIKINGPGASVAQDLEPEYITISADSSTAWVSLQENNAIAKINIGSATVDTLIALGEKDFGLAENALDASDKDDMVNIRPYEGVYGLYMPDTVASYQWHGSDFVVMANEGDSRDYDGFSEEARAEDLVLAANHPQVAAAQDKSLLGRLKVTTSMGDADGDGNYEKIYAYGARSFSILDGDGRMVFDSGSDFERITASLLGLNFNNNNEENKGDSRSDDKGPEPEALAVGKVGDKTYAFIGLERTGGIMVYNITNPFDVHFVDYIVNRDFDTDFEVDTDTGEYEGNMQMAGDLGPEGMKFVPAEKSPFGVPMLVVGNEVSGTTSIYRIY